jgi:ribosomal protein S18 acetylase RimI-like enzyme
MSGLAIRELERGDLDGAVSVWNACCGGPPNLVYKTHTPQSFSRLFLESQRGVAKRNYVALSSGSVVGFACGTVCEGEPRGYLTTVMVGPGFRRRGVGSELLRLLEQSLYAAAEKTSLERIEVMFFNPVTLGWNVPGTPGHDHPNAPGVDVSCDGYLFLKNMGYRDTAYENSYYRDLHDYAVPGGVAKREQSLKGTGITITHYDPDRHTGLDALFDDLGNEQWREIVTKNVTEGDPPDPVLIAESAGTVIGFTGPTNVEPSGRGYFPGIGVHSAYRGGGVGTVLFTHLCVELKRIGATFMTLFTGETNPARKIYEAAGFKIVRTWACMRKHEE